MREPAWLIVPCYNEQDRFDRAAFAGFMGAADAPFILFVEDGSTDDTARMLLDLARAPTGGCGVLQLPSNVGKAEAVRAGLNTAIAAGVEYVGYWDADLSTPLSAYRALMAEFERTARAEAVMGARVRMLGREIERSGRRHYVGRIYATLASLVLRLPVYDTQCGAKMFRVTPALRRALATPFLSRWGFDVELLRRLQLCWGSTGSDRIIEVPLSQWRDVRGSKVSLTGGLAAFVALLRLTRLPEPPPLPLPETEDSPPREVAASSQS